MIKQIYELLGVLLLLLFKYGLRGFGFGLGFYAVQIIGNLMGV